MSTRKRNVRIEVNASNLQDLLKELDLDSCKVNRSESINLIIEIDINETPEMYKKLSTNTRIINWEFLEDNEPHSKYINIINNLKDAKISNEVEELKDNNINIENYNNLATYVEAVWRLSKNSTILFETDEYNTQLKKIYDEIGNSPVTIEHALLNMILESYYKNGNIKEAIEDTKNKIKENWVYLSSHPSLASVSKFLYQFYGYSENLIKK